MKASATRECKDGFDDGATRVDDPGACLLQVGTVEHDQHAALFTVDDVVGAVETTIDARIGEGGVVGPEIIKVPAENRLEEQPGLLDVFRRNLEVVYFFVVIHFTCQLWAGYI